MKKLISDLYNSFIGSLDNEKNKGFSGRKLTAFVLTVVVVIVHIKWIWGGDFTQLENVLMIDYAFISALFGMTTFQSIKEGPKSISSMSTEQVVKDGIIKTEVNESKGV